MRSYLVVILAVLCLVVEGGRVRRETDCDQGNKIFTECNIKARNDYQKAYGEGDDGKPDWIARKSCNYVTTAVETCGDLLVGECYSLEEVNNMKDIQTKGIIEQLEKQVKYWDSSKCPAYQAFMERNPAWQTARMVMAAVEENAPVVPDENEEENTPQDDTTTSKSDNEDEVESESTAESESITEPVTEQASTTQEATGSDPEPNSDSDSESESGPDSQPESESEHATAPETKSESLEVTESDSQSENSGKDKSESGGNPTPMATSVLIFLICLSLV